MPSFKNGNGGKGTNDGLGATSKSARQSTNELEKRGHLGVCLSLRANGPCLDYLDSFHTHYTGSLSATDILYLTTVGYLEYLPLGLFLRIVQLFNQSTQYSQFYLVRALDTIFLSLYLQGKSQKMYHEPNLNLAQEDESHTT